jgi:hypothetical protein
MISGSRTFRIGHWEFFSHSDLGISDFRLHSPRYFNQAANALSRGEQNRTSFVVSKTGISLVRSPS